MLLQHGFIIKTYFSETLYYENYFSISSQFLNKSTRFNLEKSQLMFVSISVALRIYKSFLFLTNLQ
jgi:hypothetical protein